MHLDISEKLRRKLSEACGIFHWKRFPSFDKSVVERLLKKIMLNLYLLIRLSYKKNHFHYGYTNIVL